MKIGKAQYCNDCGVEVTSGDYCATCNPINGSEEISYTFLCTLVEQEPVTAAQSTGQTEDTHPHWQFWKR